MKTTGIPQVAALLAAMTMALPACVAETGDVGTNTAATAQAGAELNQEASDGPAGKDRGARMRTMMKERFAAADANSDGQLTRQEMEQTIAARFAKADSDNNGALNAAELEAMNEAHQAKKAKNRGQRGKDGRRGRRGGPMDGKMADRMLGHMDSNDDGNVSLDEFSVRAMRHFEKADADGNGAVTLADMETATKDKKGRRGRGGKGGKQGRRGGGMERLLEADANDDGQITRAEAVAYRSARFAELDANNDGFLSDDERPTKQGRRGSRRGGEGKGRGGQGQGRGFAQMDQNDDGQVSKDEFLAGTDKMFERHDENGDDIISADELQRRPKNKGRRGRRGSARVGD